MKLWRFFCLSHLFFFKFVLLYKYLCCVCCSGAPLFDSSSNFTDPQTLQLLQHSQRLLTNLSTIFQCLLSEAQELTQKGAVSTGSHLMFLVETGGTNRAVPQTFSHSCFSQWYKICHSFNGLRNLEAKVPFSGFSASRGLG